MTSEIKEIYLDNSATTRISPEALEVYERVSREYYGNPSSLHNLGFMAEGVMKEARERILASVGAKDSDVIFTASGSEANNLAIIGRALSKERYKKNGRIVTTMGEHASVTEPLKRLAAEGFKVDYLPTKGGLIDPKDLEKALTPDVILVTVMMVNNETGAVYDIPAIARAMKARCPEAVLHVDATQSYMKIPFIKAAIGADMITLSSHKIEGPKGVGALIVDKKLIKTRGLSPLILGGGQEGGLRSGTENVPGIAAFAEAVRLGKENLTANIQVMTALRQSIIDKLGSTPGLSEISPTLPKNHAPHILNVTLPGIKSETMLHYLSAKGIYVSSGSACSSNSSHMSSALLAYGRSEREADCSIRISLSGRNTEGDIEALCEGLCAGLATLSRMK